MQAQGKIVQCIGAVVDVEFPRDQMPKIYDALKMEGSALTLEVQQQLGDGVPPKPYAHFQMSITRSMKRLGFAKDMWI